MEVKTVMKGKLESSRENFRNHKHPKLGISKMLKKLLRSAGGGIGRRARFKI